MMADILTEVAFGSMTGLIAGYSLKKLGQLIALGLIIGYGGLQLAKNKGWISDNQLTGVSVGVTEFGRKQMEDLGVVATHMRNLMNYGVPSALSFGGGFYVGFFYG